MIGNQIFFKKNNQCYDTFIGEQVVLLEAETCQYYWLNETASMLWQWLDKPISPDQLTENLSRQYHPNLTLDQQDIQAWLKDAVDKKILSTHESNDWMTCEAREPHDNKKHSLDENNFVLPQTHSLDIKNINGNPSQFQTDNFETGS